MTRVGESEVAEQVSAWVEKAVIGLNLCPFAKAAQVKGLVHYEVSGATSVAQLLEDLTRALDDLVASDPLQRETTLLVAPYCLEDFLDFNDFLGQADFLLESRELVGVIQLASFHPCYQFAGTAHDDITNFTNRAPWPVLHLLREDSIDRAVQAFPQAQAIFEANIGTMLKLGPDGWNALNVGPKA